MAKENFLTNEGEQIEFKREYIDNRLVRDNPDSKSYWYYDYDSNKVIYSQINYFAGDRADFFGNRDFGIINCLDRKIFSITSQNYIFSDKKNCLKYNIDSLQRESDYHEDMIDKYLRISQSLLKELIDEENKEKE